MHYPGPELPGLLSTWFAGWTALRTYSASWASGHPAALRRDTTGGWEYFIADPDPWALASLAAVSAETPNSTVSVWGSDVQRYVNQAHLAGMSLVTTAEALMVWDMSLADAETPYLADPDFTLSTTRLGGRHGSAGAVLRYAATIRRGQTLAAWGTVAVVGESAVFDQLQTAPDFRRRGFGRMVVDALAARALDHPVRQGLLLASPAGQQLYTKLGWHRACPVTVLAPRQRTPVAQ